MLNLYFNIKSVKKSFKLLHGKITNYPFEFPNSAPWITGFLQQLKRLSFLGNVIFSPAIRLS